MNIFSRLLCLIKPILPIIKVIYELGGKSYLVGGVVRDMILEQEIKDIDIEVHGISSEKLHSTLSKFGNVDLIGKQFGVFIIKGIDVDWSLPRRDSKGRKPTVEVDPNMSIKDASRRRDLTMNSMAIDMDVFLNNFEFFEQSIKNNVKENFIKKLEIIDSYDGLKDIDSKILRAPDNKLFIEDPLRFFRVMQFLSRFGMKPSHDLEKICKEIHLHDSNNRLLVARERVFDEIKKLFLKSTTPSLGFRWLLKIKRLEEIFHEISNLVGVKQREDFHPEGDVFEHTMQCLDASSRLDLYKNSENMTKEEEKLIIMLAILCHDLGKAVVSGPDGRAFGHDKEGVEIAKSLIKRITDNSFLLKSVCKFVLYHMRPFDLLRMKAKSKAYKKLAFKLAPEISMRQLGILALADYQGRNGKIKEPLESGIELYNEFIEKIVEVNVLDKPEEPILKGRDIIDVVNPGKNMGDLLRLAYKFQIEDDIKDIVILKKLVLNEYKK